MKELIGKTVRLEPLETRHFEPLWAVAQHPSLWQYMPFPVSNQVEFKTLLTNLLKSAQQGVAFPFVTIVAQQVVGSTSYLAIEPTHKRLEIGSTWVTPDYQRTATNTEAKLLQLTCAFEDMGYNRVEFKTDSLNKKSQIALARLGAIEEGTFRNHMIMPDGRIRHSVYYSITHDEWPAVKQRLQDYLK